MKPCVNGERHKWVFQRNCTRGVITKTTSRVTHYGVYECSKCEATKEGKPK